MDSCWFLRVYHCVASEACSSFDLFKGTQPLLIRSSKSFEHRDTSRMCLGFTFKWPTRLVKLTYLTRRCGIAGTTCGSFKMTSLKGSVIIMHPAFQTLKNKLFSVSDGNHRLFARMQLAEEYPHDEKYHLRVVYRILQGDPTSFVHIESAMHALNRYCFELWPLLNQWSLVLLESVIQ